MVHLYTLLIFKGKLLYAYDKRGEKEKLFSIQDSKRLFLLGKHC